MTGTLVLVSSSLTSVFHTPPLPAEVVVPYQWAEDDTVHVTGKKHHDHLRPNEDQGGLDIDGLQIVPPVRCWFFA